ncbi:MAG: GTP 3',8-cyclase MoaA [Acidobacteriota bacterium]
MASLPHRQPQDRLGRPIRDLRISVTDRCNFRCRYCMPKEVFGADFPYLPRAEILDYEEVARLGRIFRRLGVRKTRLTGGEPLLRRDLPLLIEQLVAIEGLEVTLTTNGALLERLAPELARAGLARVTVSLDSLDDAQFRRMNDVDFPVARVLAGIEAAAAAGLTPVKVNAVIHRKVNDDAVLPLARHFHGSGHILRFIEYMDVGTTNGWRLDDVVPGREILDRLRAEFPIAPVEPAYRGEVAQRWSYRDGGGEFGVITSVSQPFCGDCTRARLSAEGSLYTCLFASRGTDLRGMVRDGSADEEIEAFLHELWGRREDRYSELRTAETPTLEARERVEMSYIGG